MNVGTPSGTVAMISRARDSSIGPGPLGIRITKPNASAPASSAIAASPMLAMQQILMRVRGEVDFIAEVEMGRQGPGFGCQVSGVRGQVSAPHRVGAMPLPTRP